MSHFNEGVMHEHDQDCPACDGDPWRSSREKLKAEADAQHARIDDALSGELWARVATERAATESAYRSVMDRDGGPAPLPTKADLDSAIGAVTVEMLADSLANMFQAQHPSRLGVADLRALEKHALPYLKNAFNLGVRYVAPHAVAREERGPGYLPTKELLDSRIRSILEALIDARRLADALGDTRSKRLVDALASMPGSGL